MTEARTVPGMNSLRIVTRLAVAGGIVAIIGMLIAVNETFQLATGDYSPGVYTTGVWLMFLGCAAAIAMQLRRETLMDRDRDNRPVRVEVSR
ncbi:hypothetical protein [Paenarthrobacter sp. C1]|uniref:hypothetical protein n=1 Tax=Paenarthrobacter sp. C1 TaxID=3400220 RepID=UPI003BF47E7D